MDDTRHIEQSIDVKLNRRTFIGALGAAAVTGAVAQRAEAQSPATPPTYYLPGLVRQRAAMRVGHD